MTQLCAPIHAAGDMFLTLNLFVSGHLWPALQAAPAADGYAHPERSVGVLRYGEAAAPAWQGMECSGTVQLSMPPPGRVSAFAEYFSCPRPHLTTHVPLLQFNTACPSLFGTPTEFRKNFEHPILAGRDANATDKQLEKVGGWMRQRRCAA